MEATTKSFAKMSLNDKPLDIFDPNSKFKNDPNVERDHLFAAECNSNPLLEDYPAIRRFLDKFIRFYFPYVFDHRAITFADKLTKAYIDLYVNLNEKFKTYPPSDISDPSILKEEFHKYIPYHIHSFEFLFSSPVDKSDFEQFVKFVYFIDDILFYYRQRIKNNRGIFEREVARTIPAPSSTGVVPGQKASKEQLIKKYAIELELEEEERLPDHQWTSDCKFVYFGRPIEKIDVAHNLMKTASLKIKEILPEEIENFYYSWAKYNRMTIKDLNNKYSLNADFYQMFEKPFQNFKINYERVTGTPQKQKQKRMNLLKNLNTFIKANYNYDPSFPPIRFTCNTEDLPTVLYNMPYQDCGASIFNHIPFGDHFYASIIYYLYAYVTGIETQP